jgi:hypothetical protein
VIVLLYGGKEGIHIDMYDLAMAHVARSRKRLLTEKRGISYREGREACQRGRGYAIKQSLMT